MMQGLDDLNDYVSNIHKFCAQERSRQKRSPIKKTHRRKLESQI